MHQWHRSLFSIRPARDRSHSVLNSESGDNEASGICGGYSTSHTGKKYVLLKLCGPFFIFFQFRKRVQINRDEGQNCCTPYRQEEDSRFASRYICNITTRTAKKKVDIG